MITLLEGISLIKSLLGDETIEEIAVDAINTAGFALDVAGVNIVPQIISGITTFIQAQSDPKALAEYIVENSLTIINNTIGTIQLFSLKKQLETILAVQSALHNYYYYCHDFDLILEKFNINIDCSRNLDCVIDAYCDEIGDSADKQMAHEMAEKIVSGVNENYRKTIIQPTVSYLTINGVTQVDENSSASYTCTATYSDGSTANVTYNTIWSENSEYADISNNDIIFTQPFGISVIKPVLVFYSYLHTFEVSKDETVIITATYGDKTDTHTVTIKNGVPIVSLSHITISGASQVDENSGSQYTCTAVYSDGSTKDVTGSVNWSVNSSYASINQNGYLSTFEVTSDQSITISYSGMGQTFIYIVTIKNKSQSGDFANTLGMTFKLIPAGTFMMGSPSTESGRGSDETQHQVTLTKSYYMQTTEVTQGQWKAVMGSNPSYFQNCGDNCPVERVSWNDIQTFITKLNAMGQGTYSLPTEAQWEYAARAGSTTAFANGGITQTGCGYDANLDKMGWYCGNSDSKTHQVAQKTPNSWGLYDMHGNVYEWCQDWYLRDYGSAAVIDPVGPGSGSGGVVRGGSWGNGADGCRSAGRRSDGPSNRLYISGFRLVCSAGHQ